MHLNQKPIAENQGNTSVLKISWQYSYLAKESYTDFVHKYLQNLVCRLFPRSWNRGTLDAIDICDISTQTHLLNWGLLRNGNCD